MGINKDLIVAYLRCEYKTNPLGIDSSKPRLSWIIESLTNQNGQCQTAYQIAASSTKENLDKNIFNLWNSGKVKSVQQNQIEYNGKELNSKEECWWKVKIWDKDDEETVWSEPAYWLTGLLNKNDWKAKWIGFNEWERNQKKNSKYEFKAGEDKWIWYPINQTFEEKGIGNYIFRKKIIIEDINEICSAKLLITADERFILYINGDLVDKSDNKIFSWTRPKLIEGREYLKNGENIILVEAANTYLSKPGLSAKLFLEYSGGSNKIVHTDISWQTLNSTYMEYCRNNDNSTGWQNAGIAADMGEKPWKIPKVDLFLPPPPYLRREFELKNKIKNAFLFASSLGLYKLFINGRAVTENKFTPGWTDYSKRVYYNTYNVKELFNSSDKNCLGVILADGWYAGYIGWEKRREYFGENPVVLLQLEIEYEDGSIEIIFSDENWKASYGPILEADILMGETYDAKKELTGWNGINYNDSGWNEADLSDDVNFEINSYPGLPVRKTLELKPVAVTSPADGIYIFDLGQNISGCARLKVDGRKSGKIILRFGEMLDENGNLYTENLRMARAADTYFTKGEPEEIWEPEFTYHGFRYIELNGLNEMPGLEIITGIVLHSDLPITGSFECSNEKLNKLYQNIFWSQRANFMDIPTDCPQRDERLGWTADAVDFIRTASFNMDTSAFYSKWLQDLNDAQELNGAYPAIAPKLDLAVGPLYSGAAGFADAGIFTPYYLYKFYNDISILKKYYNNMIKFMNYLEANEFKRPGKGYGDWLSVNADTPQDLIDTAFYAYDAKLMKEISSLLNKKPETDYFNNLFEKVKTHFNNTFVNKDGSILSGTQTSYVLPLYFNLLMKRLKKNHFNF